MEDFKDYILEKETIDEEFLGEDAALTAALILGIPTAGAAIAYGGAQLLFAAAKGTRKIIELWKKAIAEWKNIKKPNFNTQNAFGNYYKKVKTDPLVRRMYNSETSKSKEYSDVLKSVYEAIEAGDFGKENNMVKEEFLKIPRNLQNSPDVKRVIINAIIKKTGEPPLWPPSPGNKTYQAIKFSIGIREAKAMATAFRMSAVKNMDEE
jgi:hypothetical protein